MIRLERALILLALAVVPLVRATGQGPVWVRQSGTSTFDYCGGISVNLTGDSYLVGDTYGNLAGPNGGGSDVVLIKYDVAGALIWTRQYGTSQFDVGRGIAVDSAGNIYIAGHTGGDLGGPNAGGDDAYLAKYSSLGTLLWTRQIGTSAVDRSAGVAIDSAGNTYMIGYTYGNLGGPHAGSADAFVSKHNASGSLLWTRQVGTVAFDEYQGAAVDAAGNIYISGRTAGSLGGPNAGADDIFLVKYDGSGLLLWTRQFGTSQGDFDAVVAVDSAGDVYIGGSTTGSLGGPQAGNSDIFLAKYDGSGAPLWVRQMGTTMVENVGGVAVDFADNVFVSGQTYGSIGASNEGFADVFVVRYSASGTPIWTRQLGTSSIDSGGIVATDSSGEVLICGNTSGSLGGPNAGGPDIFLAKYGAPFCPADYNEDKFVSGDDFDQFVADFELGLDAADVNEDKFVSGDDFDFFVEHFEAGC